MTNRYDLSIAALGNTVIKLDHSLTSILSGYIADRPSYCLYKYNLTLGMHILLFFCYGKRARTSLMWGLTVGSVSQQYINKFHKLSSRPLATI